MKLLSIGTLFSLVLLISSCSEQTSQVTVAAAQVRNVTQSILSSGKIYPEVEVSILPEAQGEIEKIYVSEGDTVSKGQRLLDINPEIIQEQVNQLEAQVLVSKANLENAKANKSQAEVQLKQAEIEFNRNKKLYEQKIVTDIDYVNVQSQYEIAKISVTSAEQQVKSAQYNLKSQQANLRSAKTTLSRTTIYAPMDGIVTGIYVEEGNIVAGVNQFNATQVITVAKLDIIEVRINVGENDVLKINKGDEATVEVDAYLGKKFKGSVSAVSSSAGNGQSSVLTTDQPSNYEVKIRINPNSYSKLQKEMNKFPFLPGMSASVNIATKSVKNAITIPIESVTVREDLLSEEELQNNTLKEFVFILNAENKAVKREVKTGIQDQRYIQILSGIKTDETVLRGPYNFIHKDVKDGQLVSVTSSESLGNKESGISVEIN